MRPIVRLLCLAPLALGACGTPGHYPISGQPCSPDDPVHQMNEGGFRMINLLPATPAASCLDLRLAPTVPPAR